MALVFYSGHVAYMRGSVGGATHSNNLAGSFIRQRVRTPQKSTSRVSFQKNNFAGATQSWAYLAHTDATQWNLIAPPGLSGFNVFVAYYLNAIKIGVAPPTAPLVPALMTPNPVLAASISLGSNTFDVDFPASAPSDQSFVIFASPPQRPNTQFNRGNLKLITVADLSSSFSVGIFNEYSAVYGSSFPMGAFIWLDVEQIHNTQLNPFPSSQMLAIVAP